MTSERQLHVKVSSGTYEPQEETLADDETTSVLITKAW